MFYFFPHFKLSYHLLKLTNLPTTLKNKGKGVGIAFGVPALYAINVLRLVIVTLVGLSHPNMFEFVHVYLWQVSFIIFVVVLFLLWLKLVAKD